MNKNSPVWIKNPDAKDTKEGCEELWLPTLIESKKTEQGVVAITVNVNDKPLVIGIPINAAEGDTIKLRDPAINIETLDILNLTHVNEPEILSLLKLRYQEGLIFTKAGNVIISLNPFDQVTPSDECVQFLETDIAKILTSMGTEVVPVPPPTDENGTTSSAAGKKVQQNKHSILLSGESGSGKSECFKLILHTFVATADPEFAASLYLGRSVSSGGSNPSSPVAGRPSLTRSLTMGRRSALVEKILQGNKILESFANARTIYSRNSSRFCKLFELKFNNTSNKLEQGRIRTFLLESSRICSQHQQARNFNIFYELLAGASEEKKEALHLKSVHDYALINRTIGCSAMDLQQDANNYEDLVSSLAQMQMSEESIHNLFEIVAGILSLGQINAHLNQAMSPMNTNRRQTGRLSITATSYAPKSQSFYDENAKFIVTAAELLGISRDILERLLTIKVLVTPNGESFELSLNDEQTRIARDAIIKLIYRGVFDWLVTQINLQISLASAEENSVESTVAPPNPTTNPDDDDMDPNEMSRRAAAARRAARGRASKVKQKVILILDMFGFESFQYNALDELCINYANEAIQSQFYQQIYQSEMTLYEEEQIMFHRGNLPNNMENLALIGNGIFKILDDQCRLPNPTDKRFVAQLYKDFDFHALFTVSKLQHTQSKFTVIHFAGPVEYSVDDFIEKNTDTAPADTLKTLSLSSNPLIVSIFAGWEEGASAGDVTAPKMTRRSFYMNKEVVTENNSKFSRFGYSFVGFFKHELNVLMKEIDTTVPHFIRCINPISNRKNSYLTSSGQTPANMSIITNDSILLDDSPNKSLLSVNTSFNTSAMRAATVQFHSMKVADQFRHCGIIEGFQFIKVKQSYVDFFNYYRVIISARYTLQDCIELPESLSRNVSLEEAKSACKTLILILAHDPTNSKVGNDTLPPVGHLQNPIRRLKRQYISRLAYSKTAAAKLGSLAQASDALLKKQASSRRRPGKDTVAVNEEEKVDAPETSLFTEEHVQYGRSMIFLSKKLETTLELWHKTAIFTLSSSIYTTLLTHLLHKRFKAQQIAIRVMHRLVFRYLAKRRRTRLQLSVVRIQRQFRKRSFFGKIILIQSYIRRYLSKKLIAALLTRQELMRLTFGTYMEARTLRVHRRNLLHQRARVGNVATDKDTNTTVGTKQPLAIPSVEKRLKEEQDSLQKSVAINRHTLLEFQKKFYSESCFNYEYLITAWKLHAKVLPNHNHLQDKAQKYTNKYLNTAENLLLPDALLEFSTYGKIVGLKIWERTMPSQIPLISVKEDHGLFNDVRKVQTKLMYLKQLAQEQIVSFESMIKRHEMILDEQFMFNNNMLTNSSSIDGAVPATTDKFPQTPSQKSSAPTTTNAVTAVNSPFVHSLHNSQRQLHEFVILCDDFYNYYASFIVDFVLEYGDGSSFARSFQQSPTTPSSAIKSTPSRQSFTSSNSNSLSTPNKASRPSFSGALSTPQTPSRSTPARSSFSGTTPSRNSSVSSTNAAYLKALVNVIKQEQKDREDCISARQTRRQLALSQKIHFPLAIQWDDKIDENGTKNVIFVTEKDGETAAAIQSLMERVAANTTKTGQKTDAIEKLQEVEMSKKNHIRRDNLRFIEYNRTVFQHMPVCPGIEYAINTFMQLLGGQFFAPRGLLKLSGTRHLSGKQAYYQLLPPCTTADNDNSSGIPGSMIDVLYNPVSIEQLDPTTFSMSMLTCCILGLMHIEPNHLLVNYDDRPLLTRKKLVGADNHSTSSTTTSSAAIKIQSFNNDPWLATSFLDFHNPLRYRVSDQNINLLFLLPQMDEPIDRDVKQYLLSSPFMAEQIIIAWLRDLYDANMYYTSLTSDPSIDFHRSDHRMLQLPITLPTHSSFEILKRLKHVCNVLTDIDTQQQEVATTEQIAAPSSKSDRRISRDRNSLAITSPESKKGSSQRDLVRSLYLSNLLKEFYPGLAEYYERQRTGTTNDFHQEFDADYSGLTSYAYVYHHTLNNCALEDQMRHTHPTSPSNVTAIGSVDGSMTGNKVAKPPGRELSVHFAEPKVESELPVKNPVDKETTENVSTVASTTENVAPKSLNRQMSEIDTFYANPLRKPVGTAANVQSTTPAGEKRGKGSTSTGPKDELYFGDIYGPGNILNDDKLITTTSNGKVIRRPVSVRADFDYDNAFAPGESQFMDSNALLANSPYRRSLRKLDSTGFDYDDIFIEMEEDDENKDDHDQQYLPYQHDAPTTPLGNTSHVRDMNTSHDMDQELHLSTNKHLTADTNKLPPAQRRDSSYYEHIDMDKVNVRKVVRQTSSPNRIPSSDHSEKDDVKQVTFSVKKIPGSPVKEAAAILFPSVDSNEHEDAQKENDTKETSADGNTEKENAAATTENIEQAQELPAVEETSPKEDAVDNSVQAGDVEEEKEIAEDDENYVAENDEEQPEDEEENVEEMEEEAEIEEEEAQNEIGSNSSASESEPVIPDTKSSLAAVFGHVPVSNPPGQKVEGHAVKRLVKEENLAQRLARARKTSMNYHGTGTVSDKLPTDQASKQPSEANGEEDSEKVLNPSNNPDRSAGVLSEDSENLNNQPKEVRTIVEERLPSTITIEKECMEFIKRFNFQKFGQESAHSKPTKDHIREFLGFFGMNFSFLPAMRLRNINAEQLSFMFQHWLLRDDTLLTVSNALTTPRKSVNVPSMSANDSKKVPLQVKMLDLQYDKREDMEAMKSSKVLYQLTTFCHMNIQLILVKKMTRKGAANVIAAVNNMNSTTTDGVRRGSHADTQNPMASLVVLTEHIYAYSPEYYVEDISPPSTFQSSIAGSPGTRSSLMNRQMSSNINRTPGNNSVVPIGENALDPTSSASTNNYAVLHEKLLRCVVQSPNILKSSLSTDEYQRRLNILHHLINYICNNTTVVTTTVTTNEGNTLTNTITTTMTQDGIQTNHPFSATTSTKQQYPIDPQWMDQFLQMLYENPSLALIGEHLAYRKVYPKPATVLHKLLAHAYIDRYVRIIEGIMEHHPETLYMVNIGGQLPGDLIRKLSDLKKFKVTLWKDCINHAGQAYQRLFGHKLHYSDRASKVLASQYVGEEELLILASRYSFPITESEVIAKQYDVMKVNIHGFSLLMQLIIFDAVHERVDRDDIWHVFEVLIKSLETRCGGPMKPIMTEHSEEHSISINRTLHFQSTAEHTSKEDIRQLLQQALDLRHLPVQTKLDHKLLFRIQEKIVSQEEEELKKALKSPKSPFRLNGGDGSMSPVQVAQRMNVFAEGAEEEVEVPEAEEEIETIPNEIYPQGRILQYLLNHWDVTLLL